MGNRMPPRQAALQGGYVDRLNALKEQATHENKEIGDQWRTPDWLFHGINVLFNHRLQLDLFTDGDNSKCPHYYTAEDNALVQSWSSRLFDIEMETGIERPMAFANPPYSISSTEDGDPLTGMRHITAKAWEERNYGAPQVHLVKASPSEVWWPRLGIDETQDPSIPKADKVIYIKGRIGFERPLWFRPGPDTPKASSAGFGAALFVFDRSLPESERGDFYITRAALKRMGEEEMERIRNEDEEL